LAAVDAGSVRRLVWENTKLGPFVQLRMLMAALPWTFYGISKAGARASIAAVDSERQATVAAIACTLVRWQFVRSNCGVPCCGINPVLTAHQSTALTCLKARHSPGAAAVTHWVSSLLKFECTDQVGSIPAHVQRSMF
jgi:hypothetical protein